MKKNNQVDLDQLKKDTSILDVLERYGVPANRQANGTKFMALCPFHEDKNPSLSVDPVKNIWHCFGCQKGGSVIDFVMEKEGLSFKDAVDILLTHSGLPVRRTQTGAVVRASELPRPRPAASTAPADRDNVAALSIPQRRTALQAVDWYHQALSGEDRRGLDYLKRRHIADPETLKAFKVGYIDGSFPNVVGKNNRGPLTTMGLLRKDGSDFFAGCIVVPILTESGELGEMYGRRIDDQTTGPKHLYLPGPHRGVLNAKAAQVYASDEIILTEAIFDALTLYAHGIKNVLPCYGTGGFLGFPKGAQSAEVTAKRDEGGTDSDTHLGLLLKNDVRKVVIAFDADKPGDTAANALAEKLTAQGIDCHRAHVPGIELAKAGLPGDGTVSSRGGQVKDINEYVSGLYQQGMPKNEITDCLKAIITKAKRFGHKRPSKKTGGTLTLTEHTAEELVFSAAGGSASGATNSCQAEGMGELTYRLRGLFDNKGNALRVILTAGRDDQCHTDRFDLYTAKSRAGFAYRTANRLELPVAKIDDDLNTLIPMLETLLAEGKNKADEPKGPPPMSESERKEALQLLRSKNLLKRLSADLETVGYVGEDRNKQLAYLIATSRKLDKPLSAIIRSESGAGKSYLMECVAELMPEEEVQYFSRLTPQSLYYMGENELVHKLLIVDERDGSEESEYPIRTLQTRRKLTLAVPMKDASSGKIKTSMLTINGPIAYMESSTQLQINPENLNRCFEIYLDESEKQTERIYALQKKAHTPEGWKVDETRAAVVRRQRNAQRLLAPVRVSIPYTKKLSFPASWTRGRRDHQRLLHLIEVVTFLHQEQREKKRAEDGGEFIEATTDDYACAYDLARSAFTQALADMPRSARQVLAQIRIMVKDLSERLNVPERDYSFRRRDVREYTRLADHQIKRAMRILEELEYVSVRRGGRGGSFLYNLTTNPSEKDPLEGLTKPEELKQACTLRQAQDMENG